MISQVHERIMATGLFGTAVYLMYLSMEFPMESRIFPLAILGLMAILSAVVFVRSFFRAAAQEKDQETTPFFRHRARFFMASGCILGYILLLPHLGYFTTSALFFIAMTTVLGFKNIKTLSLTVALFLTFVYVVFVYLFERPIPPEFFQSY